MSREKLSETRERTGQGTAEMNGDVPKHLTWSDLRQGFVCLYCGQMVMYVGGEVIHASDDCDVYNRRDEDQDCAVEGYSYAVFGSDQ